MKERKLDEHLASFYRNQKLSDDRLAELQQLIKPRPRANRGAKKSWIRSAILIGSIAALFALLAVPVFIGEDNGVTDQIVKEVTVNYTKELPFEFEATDFDKLTLQMAALDFSPAPCRRLTSEDLHVVGGRYCWIQGGVGAQIWLEDARGRRFSLVECRDTETTRLIPAQTVVRDGVTIELWHDQGLLMALAGPTN